ncbi:MAG: YceI family protein [Ignavibacteria bacterium]|nr:YceI family protein [Ignavibacteria bacterium]
MKLSHIAWLTALSVTLSSPLVYSGTQFKVGAQGKKNITLTNKVGENLIKFLSAAPLEEIKGTTSGISGSFVLDLDNLEATNGKISIDVESMNTGLNKRDSHMKGKEWLDVKKFPEIVYEIEGLSDIQIIRADNNGGEIKAMATGNFIMHGVTKQIKAPITLKFVRESDATKKRAAGDFALVQTSFKVALKDFNVKGTAGIVGSKVGESIDIDANFYGSTAGQ